MQYEKPEVEVQDFAAQYTIADTTGTLSVGGDVIPKTEL